jgi:hypothetical protein
MFAIPLELGVILFLYLFCKASIEIATSAGHKSLVLLHKSRRHQRIKESNLLSQLSLASQFAFCFILFIDFFHSSPTQTFNMRSFLQFVLSVLCLVSCILAANLLRYDSQSAPQPTPGKTYYTVFPKNGTDISKTGDFIKELVGAGDLLPWSDVNDQLMHWTVEASPDQVSQLQGNTGIDHVTEFNPPAPPAATRSIRDTSAVE